MRSPNSQFGQLSRYAACLSSSPFLPPSPPSLLSPLLLVAAVLLLNSCATLTKQQCRTADWRTLGYRDALVGWPHSRLDRHVKACNRANVEPDKEAWLKGHKQGARVYCRPANAYKTGTMGLRYHNICEPEQEPTFLRVRSVGLEYHRRISRRDSLQASIRKLEWEIGEVEKEQADGKIEKDEAERSISRIRDQIFSEKWDLEKAEEDVAAFNARLLRDGYMKIAGVSTKLVEVPAESDAQ